MDSIQISIQRIKELCDKNNLSINEMLTKSNAGARTYHNMKAGSSPSADKIQKIADFFSVSVDYLLGRTDNPNINLSEIKENNNLKNKEDYSRDETGSITIKGSLDDFFKSIESSSSVVVMCKGGEYDQAIELKSDEIKDILKELKNKKS